MTASPAKPRARTIAENGNPYVIFALAAAGAVWGIFWLPAWFLVAQMLRLWAPNAGVRWLSSRGVPEYTDDKYAQAIANVPLLIIAGRLLISVDVLEPFKVISEHKVNAVGSEAGVFLAVVVGIAVAMSLSGVMKTHGWTWLIATAGFAGVMTGAIGSYGLIWHANALEAAVLVPPAWLFSVIPMYICGRLDRRVIEEPEDRTDELRWTENQNKR